MRERRTDGMAANAVMRTAARLLTPTQLGAPVAQSAAHAVFDVVEASF